MMLWAYLVILAGISWIFLYFKKNRFLKGIGHLVIKLVVIAILIFAALWIFDSNTFVEKIKEIGINTWAVIVEKAENL